MTLCLRVAAPSDAEHLLRASHKLMTDLFPSESNHFLSLDDLEAPNIRFFTAGVDGVVVGCGALALKTGYGELKSMFVDPAVRGGGIGEALVMALIQTAKAEARNMVRLETGNSLTSAHKLYEKLGFTYRGPFGDYRDDPLSLFMEMAI